MNSDTYGIGDMVVYVIGAIAGANDMENAKPMKPLSPDTRYVAGYETGYVLKGIDKIFGE